MKKGIALFIVGGVAITAGGVVAAVRTGSLFLPTFSELLFALFPSLLLVVGGVVLILLGFVIPKLRAKNAAREANRHADAYATPTYSYDTVCEALQARVLAWENATWENTCKHEDALNALAKLRRCVGDLGKMSAWFALSLDEPLYDAAREAVGRIDADKLKMLSGFIGYCGSATEYELCGTHFSQACNNALLEVNSALEVYASMRAKLSSFSGNAAALDKLKEEINQIMEVF